MSVKKFRFVSPGIFINEVDNSQLPKAATEVGPVVIGRTERGPGMRPVQVNSFSDFVETFGNPIPGGAGGDVWRDGNYTAPTYAGYAAQAWLKNATPCTVVRLLGTHHPDRTTPGDAGWNTAGKAYGLFVAPYVSGNNNTTHDGTTLVKTLNAALSAVVYMDEAATKVGMVGTGPDGSTLESQDSDTAGTAGTGTINVISTADLEGDTVVIVTPGNTITATCHASTTGGGGTNTVTFAIGPSGDTPVGRDQTAANLASVLNAHADLTATAPGVGANTVIVTQATAASGFTITYNNVDNSSGDEMTVTGYTDGTGTSDGAGLPYATCQWVKSQGAGWEFKMHLDGKNKTFNFNSNSRKFIRNALNTNPTLTNATTTESPENYFVGETYERHLNETLDNAATSGKGNAIAILLPLKGGADNVLDKDQMNIEAQQPTTSWIFSQHLGDPTEHKISTSGTYASDVTKLFKFHGLSDGAWSSRNLKLSIADIKAGDDFDPYGTFTVILRKVEDADNAPKYVERFTGCNLNPSSSSYISKKIGDMSTEWDYTESRYKTYGQYVNMSKFVRVEVAMDIEAGSLDPQLLPFGFYGPAMPRGVTCGAGAPAALGLYNPTGAPTQANAAAGPDSDTFISDALDGLTAGPFYHATTSPAIRLIWPAMQARKDSTVGDLSSGKQAFFGASSNTSTGLLEDKAYADSVKPYSEGHAAGAFSVDTYPALQSSGAFSGDNFANTLTAGDKILVGDLYGTGIVPAFTLDDLVMQDTGGVGTYNKSLSHVDWSPGSRLAGASITVRGKDLTDYFASGVKVTTPNDGTFKDVLEHGFDQFTVPLFGGADGFDITEKEPFRNSRLDDGSTGALGNYTYNSVKRAIDSCSDPEVVEMNLAVMPGITNTGLTSHLINTCENRADALAIIDLSEDYKPNTESTAIESARVPTVDLAVSTFKTRGISSSYGCAYFPWVQIRDTVNDGMLWAPPSIVALGTMASSQRKTEVWFAPAGFNRGGLTEGSAGIPVTQARVRLTSKDRDKLYEANINPIATFPSEGLVVFGQKTLQVTASALDRINVRRLMIHLKKEVSRAAATILFENNVEATWNNFIATVEPMLASVKARYGLTEYKLVLDETTTTPDLIDRNILYAKIFLKPARAIEFIAIDFVITNTGASFDD